MDENKVKSHNKSFNMLFAFRMIFTISRYNKTQGTHIVFFLIFVSFLKVFF